MDAITHLLVGLLLAAGIGPAAPALGALAVAFAVLPDVDTVTWFVPSTRRWLRHRGATHTIPFGAAAAAVAAAWFHAAGWAPFGPAFLVAFVAFLSHVALDVLNWGAPVLWPWRKERVEWTVHGGFRTSALASAAGVLALAGAQAWAPALHRPLAAGLAAAFAGYFGLRAAQRLRGRRVLPGRRLVPRAASEAAPRAPARR